MNYEKKRGDLILPQGTFVFIQDGASGQVQVAVGPYKESLGEIDKLVTYNERSRKFVEEVDLDDAIQVCPTADEGQYIILINPADTKEGKESEHPTLKKSAAAELKDGSKINIPGPDKFALYPGQVGKVLDGHNLKYNEYLIVRVYNEEEAKTNIENAIVKLNEDEEVNNEKSLFTKDELVTGKLLVIKGTDVSFYIPPTGIEVLSENGSYVRNAVTLERLEYCILLDQNGDKRYVKGPDVVFPKPTEEFMEDNGKNKFKAIELNDNMGIYIKVIADYTDDKGLERKTGEELFITGKEQKIYFPREEHAIIKYGDSMIHYAVAITDGEARYVLDKENGKVNLVKGPNMFIPDPRKEVIVKRILDDKTIKLWFPGNNEALDHNQNLQDELNKNQEFSNNNYYTADISRGIKKRVKATLSSFGDEMTRNNTYTKPRTLTIDSKYEGAVTIDIWPGFAIQKIKKSGERQVIKGPKVCLLDYDETLEVLALSTGKPKRDHELMRTVYLQTENNIVSDIVAAETKDLVNVNIRISYRVNFEEEYSRKWFNVSDYVKLMTQHLRSIIRNRVKKENIEEFNDNAADMIRNSILGEQDSDGKRTGRLFSENGMKVYDLEVLNIEIGDNRIEERLREYQKEVVFKNLDIKKLEKESEFHKRTNELKRQKLEEVKKTEEIENDMTVYRITEQTTQEKLKREGDAENQKIFDEIEKMAIEIKTLKDEKQINKLKEESDIRTKEHERKMAAIQPRLIESMITLGGVKTTEVLAKNLKEQGGNLTSIFQKGGFEGLLETVKGTPIYDNLSKIFEEYKILKEETD